MPDDQEKDLADEEAVPDTPLHAHAEGREDDVVGEEKPEVGEEGDLEGSEEGPPGNPVPEDSE
jgi:hypothetical protein